MFQQLKPVNCIITYCIQCGNVDKLNTATQVIHSCTSGAQLRM